MRAKPDLVPDCDLHGEPMYMEQCRASALGWSEHRDIHVWRCAHDGCARYFHGTVGYRQLSQNANTAETPLCVREGAFLVAQRNLGLYICPVAGCSNALAWRAQSIIENGLPSPDESDQRVEKLRVYLTSLKAQGQLLPVEGGRPNIGAIARAAGVPRSTLYVDSVKRLFVELMGVSINGRGRPRGSSRAHEQPDSPRLLQLEQQLARAKAETEELRRQLAMVEEKVATK